MAMITPERDLEESLVTKLRDLKYEYRPDIRDRAKLEANFREKFEPLNRVNLTDGEFQRLLDEIVTPDVYEAARSLRNREAFIRDDGTPLNYTLVNIKDWCKNTFEVVNQLRINTDNSHHRYDVMLLINGVRIQTRAFADGFVRYDSLREFFTDFGLADNGRNYRRFRERVDSAIGRPRRRIIRARSSKRPSHMWSRTGSRRPIGARTCSSADGS